uniref:Uncharacterized protein n=1 Tax=Prymnesium polylepis TaxID=72548 RepID=A0A6T7WAR9_9EUKA
MRCTQRTARDCSSHTMYNDHLRLCQTLDARSERFCVLEVIWSALDRSRRRLALPSSLHAQRGGSATCGPLDSVRAGRIAPQTRAGDARHGWTERTEQTPKTRRNVTKWPRRLHTSRCAINVP